MNGRKDIGKHLKVKTKYFAYNGGITEARSDTKCGHIYEYFPIKQLN
jgi:hypothetical protein